MHPEVRHMIVNVWSQVSPAGIKINVADGNGCKFIVSPRKDSVTDTYYLHIAAIWSVSRDFNFFIEQFGLSKNRSLQEENMQ